VFTLDTFAHVFIWCCVFGFHSSSINSSTDTKGPVSQSGGTLLIGSGPLPARAPPEKKAPAATTQPSDFPKVSALPPLSSAMPVVSEPQPVMAPAPVPAPVPPPARPVIASTSLPKLTQPLPLASRPPLPNVARGVAAAFLEQEDDDNETTADAKTLTSAAQNSIAAKKIETSRLAVSKAPAPVPPPVTPPVTTASKLSMAKGDFMMGLSGMSYSDMVLAAQMQKSVSTKALGQDYLKSRTSENARAQTKPSYSSRRPRLSKDSKGRKKLEIGRNVM